MAAASSKDALIYQQIEQAAGIYQPAVYQLLSFYHALDTEAEPLDGQFIPLTSVRVPSVTNGKLFAIGLIPPASLGRSARLLDRSATAQALEGSYDVLLAENPDVGSSSTGDLPGESGGIATSTTVPVGPTQTSSDDFYVQFVAMCNRLGCQPEELAHVIQTESGWKASAVAKSKSGAPIAKGLIQLVKSTALGLGMTAEQYATFERSSDVDQLPWIEKFYKGRAKGRTAAQLKAVTFGGFNNPDGSIYSSVAVTPPFKQADFQHKAYQENAVFDGPPVKGYITPDDLYRRSSKVRTDPKVLAAIQRAKDQLGMGPNAPYKNEEAPTPDNWVEDGSKNANKAAKTSAQVANKDLNQTNLGKEFLAAQRSMAKLTQAALEQMAQTPPLRLLVNPQSFRVSAEKVISSGNWGRNGPIIEQWGENQDKIEGSGRIAAFYAMDASNATGPGLTRNARQFSTSYQNLLSLFLLYKNNGGVWFPDPLSPASAGVKNLSVIGSVYLYYDDILYIGSFDSLNLSEAEGAPHTLEYSFSFTVRAWYLLDHLDDPQYTYGTPATVSLPTGTAGSPLSGGNNAQPRPWVGQPGATTTSESDPLYGLTSGTLDENLTGL